MSISCRDRSLLEAVASSPDGDVLAADHRRTGLRHAGELRFHHERDARLFHPRGSRKRRRTSRFRPRLCQASTPAPAPSRSRCLAALRFKCDVLWAQLDALYHAYVEPGHIPPGAFVPDMTGDEPPLRSSVLSSRDARAAATTRCGSRLGRAGAGAAVHAGRTRRGDPEADATEPRASVDDRRRARRARSPRPRDRIARRRLTPCCKDLADEGARSSRHRAPAAGSARRADPSLPAALPLLLQPAGAGARRRASSTPRPGSACSRRGRRARRAAGAFLRRRADARRDLVDSSRMQPGRPLLQPDHLGRRLRRPAIVAALPTPASTMCSSASRIPNPVTPTGSPAFAAGTRASGDRAAAPGRGSAAHDQRRRPPANLERLRRHDGPGDEPGRRAGWRSHTSNITAGRCQPRRAAAGPWRSSSRDMRWSRPCSETLRRPRSRSTTSCRTTTRARPKACMGGWARRRSTSPRPARRCPAMRPRPCRAAIPDRPRREPCRDLARRSAFTRFAAPAGCPNPAGPATGARSIGADAVARPCC